MDWLHAAALPFQSSQGTQAALLAYANASARSARRGSQRVGLLSYEAGDGRVCLESDVLHHRSRALIPNRSLRSGPSVTKLAEDLDFARCLRALPAGRLLAHHVEAALIALCLGRPYDFVMHTALAPELPLYLPERPRVGSSLRIAGELVDRVLVARAERVYTVSPYLAARVHARSGRAATVLPIPWSVAPPASADERLEARTRLGVHAGETVLLYAGNLDHYQGLEVALEAVTRVAQKASRVRWLVATQSDASALKREAERLGLREVLICTGLADDVARRQVHVAADVAIVPRRLEAGVSVKLLEAFAHGLPTVAVRASTGGFAMEGAAQLVEADGHAFAEAILQLVRAPELRTALGEAAHGYLREHHSDAAMEQALQVSACAP